MTKDEALTMALIGITKVPTLTHGLLVKLADVETAIKEALAQPEQEPVAWAYVNSDDECEQIEYCTESPMPEFVPLYTSPPQRQPLTDDKLDALALDDDGLPNSHFEFARAIEAAHGIGDKT